MSYARCDRSKSLMYQKYAQDSWNPSSATFSGDIRMTGCSPMYLEALLLAPPLYDGYVGFFPSRCKKSHIRSNFLRKRFAARLKHLLQDFHMPICPTTVRYFSFTVLYFYCTLSVLSMYFYCTFDCTLTVCFAVPVRFDGPVLFAVFFRCIFAIHLVYLHCSCDIIPLYFHCNFTLLSLYFSLYWESFSGVL